jgi:serine/threonine-protein kinase RsbW
MVAARDYQPRRDAMEDLKLDLNKCSRQFHYSISGDREAVVGAAEQIMETVREMSCAKGHFNEIRLALVEALANAIIHGNKEDPSKKVTVHGACEGGGQLLLVITDEGEGFDPARLPDPTVAENVYASHGRGVYLINQLMSEAEYRLGGRQVVLRKRVEG